MNQESDSSLKKDNINSNVQTEPWLHLKNLIFGEKTGRHATFDGV